MKRTGILIAIITLAVTLQSSAQVSFGEGRKINDGWRFVLADEPGAAEADFNDRKWEAVDLPHDWSVRGQLSPTLASCTGYLPGGIGWYRKTLRIPAEEAGRKHLLYFEGVYNYSDVYVNGHHLGHRPSGYVSFMYDATPYLNYEGDNVIAVRVDHSRYADSRWYTGSGIYRNVWLVSSDPVHITRWGVFAYPVERKGKYSLRVSTEVVNESGTEGDVTVVNELFDASGRSVGKASTRIGKVADSGSADSEIKVGSPRLWSLDDPYLYTLETKIIKDGQVVDRTVTRTGLRTYTFDPDKGFALNGEWMKLKGVCLHHDAGVLGSAVPREVWEKRLRTLKSIGSNAIRTSHNPQAPDLYDLCDELGLLVIDEAFDEWEFAKRKWLAGWNKGTPGFDGAYAYFEECGERDLADMVRRDRNHVSVLAWSIGNEVDYPNDPYSHPVLDGSREGGFTQPIFGGYKPEAPDAMRLGGIAKRLAAVVKRYDATRPVTAGLAGVAMSNETEYPDALDIAGYNYTESRYVTDHEKYPDRVIYGSENRHDIDAWQAVLDNEHIFGQFLWTGIDYLGESGAWPSRGFYSGLLDFGGKVKPRGYFRKSLWTTEPMAYLGTYPIGRGADADVWSETEGKADDKPSIDAWPVWNYEPGQMVRVVCYTNTAKARLLLNGKQVGEPKNYDITTGVIWWDIPYEAGRLEVIAMNESGEQLATCEIVTSGRPAVITAAADRKEVSKEKGLVCMEIVVTDADGMPVMLSDDAVTCTLSGPGKLLGLEASNNSDMGDYTDNVQRVFNGRMIAYIQATGEEGTITARFTSPWLESATVTVRAR